MSETSRNLETNPISIPEAVTAANNGDYTLAVEYISQNPNHIDWLRTPIVMGNLSREKSNKYINDILRSLNESLESAGFEQRFRLLEE